MKEFKLTFVLTVLLSMVGVQAYAAFDTNTKVCVGTLYYYLDTSNNQAEVTSKYFGNYTGDIEIPSSFMYNSTNYDVTSIGNKAFKGCYWLTSVTIPNSVTNIGYQVFEQCRELASISVESGNTIYDSRDNCNAVIETASNTLIAGCKNSTIPNGVTSIGNSAFYGCTGLTSISIGNNVTSIGDMAFSGCPNLTSIIVESGNTKYDSRDNCNAVIETASNTLIAGCKNSTIPNGVTSIGNSAFYGCTGLTSVTIPNNVTSIGNWAFQNCSDLTSVTIPNGVTSIGNSAFYGCTGLTSISIGNSVTSFGNNAFYGCSSLTSVILNSNAFVSQTFYLGSNIKHIFGDQVTEYIIGHYCPVKVD